MLRLLKPYTRYIRWALTGICLITFVYSLVMIVRIERDYYKSAKDYDKIRDIYHQAEASAAPDPPAADAVNALPLSARRTVPAPGVPAVSRTPLQQPQPDAPPDPVDFSALKKINEQIVGWIHVPNTVIDYPVVQAEDNVYYLDHSFERKKSRAGTIFMDYRNDAGALERNTILYGHHMKDGSMFKALVKYLQQDFFEANRFIRFDTADGEQQWEVFSVYETDTRFDYIRTAFEDDEAYERFLQQIRKKSKFDTDTKLTRSDVILTLSTCSYAYDDARLVVHLRKV